MRLTQTLEKRSALSLISAFAKIEVETRLKKLGQYFGLNRPVYINVDCIKIPDTKLALEATELARQVSPEWLFNHCMRTYFFGMAVGQHIHKHADAECLFLSSVLHDLGLTPTYDTDGPFELNGARAAYNFVRKRGCEKEKATIMHEAIALHTDVGRSHKREPEIALVHFGAGVDVMGYRAEDVHARTLKDIVRRYPRLSFKEQISLVVKDQADRKPDCSITGHVELGFLKKLQQTPQFNE